jgi:hypothetical protein
MEIEPKTRIQTVYKKTPPERAAEKRTQNPLLPRGVEPRPKKALPIAVVNPPTPSPVRNISKETQVKKLAIIEETMFYKSAPNLVFCSRQ